MRCPKCNQPNYHPPEPCSRCHFDGEPELLDELARIEWLLEEVEDWRTLLTDHAQRQLVQRRNAAEQHEIIINLIRQNYLNRRRELEVALGVRLPPFTAEEAQEAWPDLFKREALLAKMGEWLAGGLVDPIKTQTMVDQAQDQMDELLEQLEGHSRPVYPQTDEDRLDTTNFLIEAVDYLRSNDGFTQPEAESHILISLLTDKEDLEIKLGLQPTAESEPKAEQPEPAPEPISEPATSTDTSSAQSPDRVSVPSLSRTPTPALAFSASSAQAAAASSASMSASAVGTASGSKSPSAPKPPLSERLWRTLLSERTLQAMLFLGIFLLFSAAISFVIWGWKDFSAPLRVAIPTGFTAIFFALGWYVRIKTPLYRSGIALSAIAALLIPIDFYTVYVNFHIPFDYWPLFWLITSLCCLAAYTITTLIINSRFFGYLVGTAAGSTVLASIEVGHQAVGLSTDWRTAGLSALALGLIMAATAIDRSPNSGRWRAFAEPFRYLSLLTIGVLLPLTFAWRFIGRNSYDTLHYALTINWWLGGFLFGWGAVFYRSRSLGLLAAISLPVATYLAQAALFNQMDISPAWHAFGWAWLVPLYFMVGYKLSAYRDDPIIYSHGRTATGWGTALLFIAALWSLTDLSGGAAAASSHALLAGSVVMAALLWRQPAYLYGASLLAFSATTFTLSELDLTLAQLSVGWTSLAIVLVIGGISLGTQFPIPVPNYARPVIISGYIVAGLALLPPLYPYDSNLLIYALGNWLGLAAWGARLAHSGQPGFVARSARGKSVFHWLAAVPLPLWLGLLLTNQRPPDFILPLALAALAWAMIFLSYRLARLDKLYRFPWYLMGGLVSLAAPVAAFIIIPTGLTPAMVLLMIGLLYFADAAHERQSGELAVAGLVTAWGYTLLLNRLDFSAETQIFALTLLIATYILAGLWVESRKSAHFTHQFLAPLYLTSHILTGIVLWQIYLHPANDLLYNLPWTNTMRLWGAAGQLVLGLVYGLYAWGTYKERWGHLAAWLIAAGGGFIAITYSTGRGSSAAKAALLALAFILAERSLAWLRRHPGLQRRQKALIRLAWPLYRRPLLLTGWVVSAGVIGLALVRNLWLLGGGRTQQLWAVAGLLLITGLYALSARLFRQARFVWLAGGLIFVPWTILTHLGWLTPYRPTGPGFALSWAVLAWLLFLISLKLARHAPPAYVFPLRTISHILLPFSLLWGIADIPTSRFTFGLAAGLYGLAAWLDHRRAFYAGDDISIPAATKFFYPALGLIPVWSVYVMAWLWPAAQHQHYGLLILGFGPLGLLAGQWLERNAPHVTVKLTRPYGLPAYLTAYISLFAGTLLVAHVPALLAWVLLYDAAMMLASARLFKNPLWVYPAAVLVPLSLLTWLYETNTPANRYGWWLIGLGALYLGLTWILRRLRLSAYSTATLTVGFALIALGLPPSSQDQIGAFWGYGSAALLYAIAAFWLNQPLLLTPVSILVTVPYAVTLQRSPLLPEYYGLALLPGAVIALAAGWGLDARFGSWRDFPWHRSEYWLKAGTDRLLGWWALPLYTLGFSWAVASPFAIEAGAGLRALSFLLLMPIFGWAIYRFRLRLWLVALALAGHLAAVYYLSALGWWRYPAWAWLRFLPVTIITAGAALLIARYRHEASPFEAKQKFEGWSHPLYALLLFDITIAQLECLSGNWAATTVTLIHALLIALLASVWLSSWLAYAGLTLGILALGQWLAVVEYPFYSVPTAFAWLALGYGLAGYGLAILRTRLPRDRELHPWLAIWELPLQHLSLGGSLVVLILTGLLSLNLVDWTVRAMFGLPFKHLVDPQLVWMVVSVLSLLGLLYLVAAYTHRWLQWGYVAIGMLLTSWILYAFYLRQLDTLRLVQWYAVPAGLYLLAIAYLEWERGNRTLGRWLDYAALLLMMGSLFWQTSLYGWEYALLLGAEGFAAFWWGSARRLRRFFYAGMVGVILATLGQLINSLQSINQWIVFGLVGLLLVLVAVFVERKLEDIKVWQEKMLETWE